MANRANIRKIKNRLVVESQIRYGTVYCCLCFKEIVNLDDITAEHFVMRTYGGKNENNIGLAHKKCNNHSPDSQIANAFGILNYTNLTPEQSSKAISILEKFGAFIPTTALSVSQSLIATMYERFGYR